ncbi:MULTISPECIES: YhcN/YlaJ family sporulation lipoprotein [Paraliobacillus]|uniref:YhcN/YlaJ family sporulation lipoprotein n=1 Tax=Paraliobacillus TaxID=200903 RepID=UPI000DD2F016|nr:MULTISPECIES: YhcN/YlaJ family sporulation lipoprotein [Paraliobacillus]
MEWKKVSIALLTVSTLVACGAQDNNELGQRGTNNLEPVRNESTLDAPFGNRNVQNGQMNNGTNGNNGTTYDGTYQRGTDLTADNVRQNNTNGNQNNTSSRHNTSGNQQGNNEYEVADKAADRIAKEVDGVDRAYVLTTNNNAYVAAELNEGNGENGNNNGEVSDEVKKQVTKAVKAENDDIDNVYVSTNPDFVNLTTGYRNDVENGEPIEGFFDQFGEMIQRVFPNQAD